MLDLKKTQKIDLFVYNLDLKLLFLDEEFDIFLLLEILSKNIAKKN